MAIDQLVALRRLGDGRTQWELLDPVETASLGLDIRALPGKGLGVVVTRPGGFQRGCRILCEAPLVAWQSSPGSSGTHDWSALDAVVGTLSEPRRRDFYGLCDKHADHGEGKTAQGIWNSNSFPTEDIIGDGLSAATDGVVRSAVYRVCSRINHACHPNCFAGWSAALGKQTVHALRDIAQGDELSVAYVGGAEAGVRESRRVLLRDKYGFECSCDACRLEGSALARSEARQTRIHEIHRMLDRSPANLVELVAEHTRLMREEGLPLIWGRAGIILALVELKNRAELRAAAELAAVGADCALVALGEDSSVFRRFDGLRQAFGAAAGEDVPPVQADNAADINAAYGNASADEGAASSMHMYEVGLGSESFERGSSAEEWPEGVGPRVLRFSLLSHRRRWAQRIWPAAQVLARYLDAHPTLVVGRAVLEIGAGAALPSVVAALLGARAVVVSDYPDDRMLQNMRANLTANLPPEQRRRAVVVGYDWNHSARSLMSALSGLHDARHGGGDGGGAEGFNLVLLSDLLYECEHEAILRAVASSLAAAPEDARALLTFQVHDLCQLPKQVAFFQLAADFGLAVKRLSTVTVGRQFEDEAGDEVEESTESSTQMADDEEDVTAQVQLWELVRVSSRTQD